VLPSVDRSTATDCYACCTGAAITTPIVEIVDNTCLGEQLTVFMEWSHTPEDEERNTERKSGTKWWYITGVAIGAGTG
jgi:hypothetical protein